MWVKYGLLYVVTTGAIMMLLLYVINLDTLPMVYNNNNYVYYYDTL